MQELEGLRVIVTGAESGIGRASVEACLASGASVVGIDRRVGPRRPDPETMIKAELTNETEVAEAVDRAVEHLSGLDAVISCAGTTGRGWLHETPLNEWHRIVDGNLTATFLVLRSTLPHMFADGGSIVTIGSTASVVITDGGTAPAYAASKAGLVQLTRQVAVDYAAHGIRANCVCPGWTDTSLTTHAEADADGAWTAERLPRTRLPSPIPGPGRPRQIADVARFLLTEGASFMTGSVVMVDGGYTAL